MGDGDVASRGKRAPRRRSCPLTRGLRGVTDQRKRHPQRAHGTRKTLDRPVNGSQIHSETTEGLERDVMRLSKIIIRRFKSLDEVSITIPHTEPSRAGSADFVSIVGENNVGKSSILEAIALACP